MKKPGEITLRCALPLSLLLPPDLEERLREEAARRGLPADVAVLQILDQHLPPAARRAAAVAMLRQWAQEDEALTDGQLATNAAVLRHLDASRSSDRSLFSDIVKDEVR